MYEKLSNEELHLVDSVCGQFEAALHDKQETAIGSWLTKVPQSVQEALLCELIVIKCEDHSLEQLRSEREHVADQLPAFSDAIRRVFDQLDQEKREAVPTLDETAGRYRILRRFASGGLGDVYLACDEELNREVALKQIQERHHGNSDSRVRFLLEAEVTGRLEHPGIVPVYGLGEYSDGRPYYAMRFIRGRSMKEAIDEMHNGSPTMSPEIGESSGETLCAATTDQDTVAPTGESDASLVSPHAETDELPRADAPDVTEQYIANSQATAAAATPADASQPPSAQALNSMELRKLLNRFIDVCQAINYAHSRGVLHRDLKPANIMLGDFGETFVVDWGLAKVADRDDDTEFNSASTSRDSDAATAMGSVIGTLPYMSPEQAEGKLQDLTATSDVYSLGATLYHLLVGHPPRFGSEFSEILRNIVGGRFKSPRRVNASIPKPLEAICLKAMSSAPEDRYTDAGDLSEDVERYLADEAVHAFADPLSVKVRRWLRKHQTLATTSVVGGLILLVALAVFSVILRSKNTQLATLNSSLESANTNLDQRNEQLIEANRVAESAKTLAQAKEKVAKEQNELAFSTLTTVVAELQESLYDLPRTSRARRSILNASIGSLRKVATDYIEKSAIDHQTALAMTRMGSAVINMGTAAVRTGGDNGEASANGTSALKLGLDFYERGKEIMTQVVEAENGQNDEHRFNLGYINFELGGAYKMAGQPEDARQSYIAAADTFRYITSKYPDNVGFKRNYFWSLLYLSLLERSLGSTAESLERTQEALPVIRSLAKTHPDDGKIQHMLACALHEMSICHATTGDFPLAVKFHTECVDVRRKRLVMDPNDLDARSQLAGALIDLGGMKRNMGKIDEAIDHLREAMELQTAIVAADPDIVAFRRRLGDVQNTLGQLYLKAGKFPEAKPIFEATLENIGELAARDPQNITIKNQWFTTLLNAGEICFELSEIENAAKYFERAFEVADELAEFAEEDASMLATLALGHEKVADFQMFGLKDPLLALKSREESVGIRRRLVKIEPENLEAKWNLSAAAEGLGVALFAVKRYDEAMSLREEVLEIRLQLERDQPGHPRTRHSVVLGHYQLAVSYKWALRWTEAIVELEKAHALATTMAQDGQMPQWAQEETQSLATNILRTERAAVACGDWNELLELPTDQRLRFLEIRAVEFDQRQLFTKSTEAAEELSKMADLPLELQYTVARIFANAAAVVTGDAKEPNAEQRQQWINKGLDALESAVSNGFNDFAAMREDPKMKALHEEPRFKKLTATTE